jgi:hypothetical protein
MKMPKEDAEALSGFVHGLVAQLEERHPEAEEFLRFMLEWVTKEFAKSTEGAFGEGNKAALMDALYVSLSNGFLPPEWALQAFTESAFVDPKSWDDIFGRPPRRRIPKMYQALVEGNKLYAQGYKKDDSNLFPALAERLSAVNGERISAGKAKELYYSWPRGDLMWLRDRVNNGALDDPTKQKVVFIIDVISGLGVNTSKKTQPKNGRKKFGA